MPRARSRQLPSEWDVLKGHAAMAKYLQVSVRTLQRWIQRGLKIPGNPRPICTRGQLIRAMDAYKQELKPLSSLSTSVSSNLA
jgi:hypothetical protein